MWSWLAKGILTRNMARLCEADYRPLLRLDTEDGRVYANRYVIWGRMRRGLLREYEVYEGTVASARLDEYLAARTSGRGPSGTGGAAARA